MPKCAECNIKQEKLSQCQQNIEVIQADLNTKQGELSQCQQNIEVIQAGLNTKQEELSQCQQNIQEIQADLKESDAEIEKLNRYLLDLTKGLEERGSLEEATKISLELYKMKREGSLKKPKGGNLKQSTADIAELEQNLRSIAKKLEDGNKFVEAAMIYEELYEVKRQKAEAERKAASVTSDKGPTEENKEACEAEKESFGLGMNLALVLTKQNYSEVRYQRAEEVLSQIWERQKQLRCENELDARKIHRQYCMVLRQQGLKNKKSDKDLSEERFKQAENMHKWIWDRQDASKSLQKNDIWRLDNGYELGLVLAEQDRYVEAEAQHERVFDARRDPDALGPTHDDTAKSALQVVLMVENQKNLEKQQRARKIEDVLRKVWTPGEQSGRSSGILDCGYKLGVCLYGQDKDAEAAEVLNEVWVARKDAVRERSPRGDIARSTGFQLALALYFQKVEKKSEKFEKAKSVLEELWESREFIQKGSSPSIHSIGHYLARTLNSLNDYDGAESLSRKLWEIDKQDYGPEDLAALQDRYEWGKALFNGKKDYKTAGEIFQEVWTARIKREKEKGEARAVETLNAGQMLGFCHLRQENYLSAIEVFRDVYTAREKRLGSNNVDTKRTKKGLDEAEEKLAAQRKKEEEEKEEKEKEKEEKEMRDRAAEKKPERRSGKRRY
jgi:hypothetical protein